MIEYNAPTVKLNPVGVAQLAGKESRSRSVARTPCPLRPGEIDMPGEHSFSVLTGRVAIRKGDKEIAVITQGKSFGGLSFLLSPRPATAVRLKTSNSSCQ